MNKSDSIGQIAKSLSLFQGEIEDLTKDKKGYGYKYADLAQCLKIIRPLLKKNGLSITQIPGFNDERVSLETVIMHESGEWIGGTVEIPVTVGKGMIPAQAYGSTISYARRYALVSHLGIATEDDDLSSIAKTVNSDSSHQTVLSNQVPHRTLGDLLERVKNKINGDEDRLKKICEFYKVENLKEIDYGNLLKVYEQLNRN